MMDPIKLIIETDIPWERLAALAVALATLLCATAIICVVVCKRK